MIVTSVRSAISFWENLDGGGRRGEKNSRCNCVKMCPYMAMLLGFGRRCAAR